MVMFMNGHDLPSATISCMLKKCARSERSGRGGFVQGSYVAGLLDGLNQRSPFVAHVAYSAAHRMQRQRQPKRGLHQIVGLF